MGARMRISRDFLALCKGDCQKKRLKREKKGKSSLTGRLKRVSSCLYGIRGAKEIGSPESAMLGWVVAVLQGQAPEIPPPG